MPRDRDPVEERHGPGEDLYDVASWDPRSRLDRIAVAVYGGLRANVGRLLVAVAFVLLVVQFALGGFVLIKRPSLDVLTALSIVPAFVLAAIIWYLDPTDREPLAPLAATFLLGVVFASFAAVLNTVLMQGFRLIPVVGMFLLFFLVVGPLEETVKWLAVRVHAYRTAAFDAVVDGMVYGAVAGLGFATIENSIYITHQFLAVAHAGAQASSVAQVRAAVATAAQRSFAGPGHVLYSAISGYYLGLAKFNPESYGPIVVKGLLVAAVVHATYDTLVTYVGFTGPTFLAFLVVYDGAVVYYIYRKLAHYRRAYRVAPDEREPAEG
ncbi:MAG: PrsW family intramembrane metalloprotease [Haloferacaceae archaeon]